MTTVNDWFDLDSEFTLEQRAFLEAWFPRAAEWEALGMEALHIDLMASANILLLIFGISDDIHHKVLIDLRVEFNGQEVRCGEDENNWLEGFSEREPVAVFMGSPAECVSFVLLWLQREWKRPVDLHEWAGENLLHQGQLYDLRWRHRRYVMPDTGRCLSYSNIGSCYDNNDDIGPPHRVMRVNPLPKNELL